MYFRLLLLPPLFVGATSAFAAAGFGADEGLSPHAQDRMAAPVSPSQERQQALNTQPVTLSPTTVEGQPELVTRVDKTTQTILITSPDILNPHLSKKNRDCKASPNTCIDTFLKYCKRFDLQGNVLPPDTCMARVSTGGGVHTTNPKPPAKPVVECTDTTTPTFSNRIIEAIVDDKNDPDNQDRHATVFTNYVSGAYQADMKWGVRLQNNCDKAGTANCGIFFHKYPPLRREVVKNGQVLLAANGRPLTYDVNQKALGNNVSGGCIRMEESVAWFINQDIRERGKMSVSLEGVAPARCTPEAMAAAQAQVDARGGQMSGNGEGWTPGAQDRNIFTDFFSLFRPQAQVQQRPVVRAR